MIEFGQLVLEKEIFKFTLSLLSPLGEGLSPWFEKLDSPSPKDDLCQVWLKLGQWFWRGRFLNDPTPFLL
jgi:hypothetical protein